MTDYQKDFVKMLKQKKNPKYNESIKRWEQGVSSPTLLTIETICNAEGIELLFLTDINSVIDNIKSLGKRLGFKAVITWEL